MRLLLLSLKPGGVRTVGMGQLAPLAGEAAERKRAVRGANIRGWQRETSDGFLTMRGSGGQVADVAARFS